MKDQVYISDVAQYDGKEIKIAAWLYNKTHKGKLYFLKLRDGSGYIQGVVFTLVCIVLLAKQAWMVIEGVTSTLMLVAPMSYPIAVLHPILQYIALGSPLTYGVESFRNFLMYGFAGPAVVQAILALIVLDVIFVVFGTLMFRYTERYVRSKGALTQF